MPAALGPTVAPERASLSLARARAAHALVLDGRVGDGALVVADEHLPALLLHAGDGALATDLAARALAPLDELRPGARGRLRTTLRAWLDHPGQVTRVAGELHVHPQTVRYRVAQLRELFGERLEDADARFELALALRAEPPAASSRPRRVLRRLRGVRASREGSRLGAAARGRPRREPAPDYPRFPMTNPGSVRDAPPRTTARAPTAAHSLPSMSSSSRRRGDEPELRARRGAGEDEPPAGLARPAGGVGADRRAGRPSVRSASAPTSPRVSSSQTRRRRAARSLSGVGMRVRWPRRSRSARR